MRSYLSQLVTTANRDFRKRTRDNAYCRRISARALVLKALSHAIDKQITPKTCAAGFRKSGFCPFNPMQTLGKVWCEEGMTHEEWAEKLRCEVLRPNRILLPGETAESAGLPPLPDNANGIVASTPTDGSGSGEDGRADGSSPEGHSITAWEAAKRVLTPREIFAKVFKHLDGLELDEESAKLVERGMQEVELLRGWREIARPLLVGIISGGVCEDRSAAKTPLEMTLFIGEEARAADAKALFRHKKKVAQSPEAIGLVMEKAKELKIVAPTRRNCTFAVLRKYLTTMGVDFGDLCEAPAASPSLPVKDKDWQKIEMKYRAYLVASGEYRAEGDGGGVTMRAV